MSRLSNLRRAAVLLLACLWPSVAACACHLAYLTDVPLTLAQGRVFLPVRFGPTTVPLMLDTGSTVSLLSRETARTVALRGVPTIGSLLSSTRAGGIGGDREAAMMVAPHFRIGGVAVPDVHFLVPGGGRAQRTGRDPDLLGMNVFGGLDVDIDLLGRRLVLYQGEAACRRPPVLMGQPLYVVPMQGDPRDTRAAIPVTLGGRTLTAVIDTGAGASALTVSAADRVGLAGTAVAADRAMTVTGIGAHPVPALRHLLANLAIGDLTVSNVHVLIIDQGFQGPDMVLGMDVLSRVHTWISNSHRAVVFQVPPSPSPPLPADVGVPTTRGR